MAAVDLKTYAKELNGRVKLMHINCVSSSLRLEETEAELDILKASYDAILRKNQLIEFKLAEAKLELAALKAGQ
jgi:hypothetical protein